jgi:hypothetical protein
MRKNVEKRERKLLVYASAFMHKEIKESLCEASQADRRMI